MRRIALAIACALALLGGLATASPAGAHVHKTEKNPHHDQELANGQNHEPFKDGVSCGGDPAWYGLETAHHGREAGDPGRDDGCYQAGSQPPADRNPGIK